MRNRWTHYAVGLLIAVAIAFVAPYLEVTNYCRNPISEQCVWGKSLIWLNRAGTFVIAGLPIAALVVWFLGRKQKPEP